MRRTQYVSQKVIQEHEINDLSPAQQDEFIKEVAQAMGRDMRERTKDAFPLTEVGFYVTGPHQDPLLGRVHVHTMTAWFDLDRMDAQAPFRLDAIARDENADTDKAGTTL